MTLGSVLIWIAAAFAALAFISALGWMKGRPSWERYFRLAYGGMTATLLFDSFLLMRAILTHDFHYDYVIGYSSRDLPNMYLISAFWGGQEGTYLLWALMGAILGFALIRRGAWQPASVMAGYVPTLGILISFMLNENGNPFRLAAQIPPDGRGLNVLLQDPWMAIHPPIVFLGYAAMTIPGVLAWVAALRRDEKSWLGDGLRFSLFGFITLGIGIILGGVWAYKVLGWGGFWGWDPVENASLVPWIIGVALIHGLLVQQTTGALRRTNLTLAMAGYLLIMYSTFLTRSGVLADFSVHSFPKGTIYSWLVAALILVAGISIVAQLRWRAKEGPGIPTQVAWPFILATTIVLFSISAILVLIGTSWPILSSIVGKPSTRTAAFYNEVNLPVYVILLVILGGAPFLSWGITSSRIWLKRFLSSLIVAGVGTVLAIVLGGKGLGPLVLFFVALLALASNTWRLIEVARRRWLHIGAAVSHVGFALMILGIVTGESWDKKQIFELPQGQAVSVFGRSLTFEGHVQGSEPKDRWGVKIDAPGQKSRTAEVVFYHLENDQIYKKPSIIRSLFSDFYLAPNSVEMPNEGAAMELTKNHPVPFRDATLTFLRFELGHGGSGGDPNGMGGGEESGGMTVKAIVQVKGYNSEETITLPLRMVDGRMQGVPTPVPSLGGTDLTLSGMSVEQGLIEVEVSGDGGAGGTPGSKQAPKGATLVCEASIKPMIGLLWLGTTLLALGCIIAFIRRTLERRTGGATPIARSPAAAGRASLGGT